MRVRCFNGSPVNGAAFGAVGEVGGRCDGIADDNAWTGGGDAAGAGVAFGALANPSLSINDLLKSASRLPK